MRSIGEIQITVINIQLLNNHIIFQLYQINTKNMEIKKVKD